MPSKTESSSQPAPAGAIEAWKWRVLALVGAAFFLIVLDFSIVNVALPSIKQALGFTSVDSVWIFSAFGIVFGGCLLLGGRCADLLGKRDVLLAGVAIFTIASLIAGLSELAHGYARAVLIGARALQGLGGALIAPACLAVINTTFDKGSERNRAMGIFGSIATAGFACGNLFGGVLTGVFGWQSIFYVNVPLGILLLTLAPRLVPRASSEENRIRLELKTLDIGGALTVTGGLASLIYAFIGTEQLGWNSPRTIYTFFLAAALLAAFVRLECTVAAPLVRLSIFRNRTLTTANIVILLVEGVNGAMIMFLSLYLQGVKGFSPENTGFAFLPFAAWMIAASNITPGFVTRFGPRPVMIVGTIFTTLATLMLSRLNADSLYLRDVLPILLVAGAGMAGAITAGFISATSDLPDEEQGLASGVVQTSQQLGAALGIATLMAVSSSYFEVARHAGASNQLAQVAGLHAAFLVGSLIAGLGCLTAILAVPRPRAVRPLVPVPAD